MRDLIHQLQNKFAFLRARIEKKLTGDEQALQLFRACHRHSSSQILQQTINETRFVVMDTETTGLHAYSGDAIIDIALIEMQGLQITGRTFQTRINPQRAIPASSTVFHHLTDKDVADAPILVTVLPAILDFIDNAVLVGHHISFDIRFINKTLQKVCHGRLQNPWLDTMLLYLEHRGQIGHYTLEEVARYCKVDIVNRHSATGDAAATAAIFTHLVQLLGASGDTIQRLIRSQFRIRARL
ncbi:MAG: 3'-5' exonuclease [Gammaproteobacteria bacterium]|nr:3'-5' exonuclease [Gammaproteobacteria bacterium]MDH5653030.1 3'-5' exonuclease [Gammaproteobacteria bacterium]